MKLIMENWRKFLREQEEDDSPPPAVGGGIGTVPGQPKRRRPPAVTVSDDDDDGDEPEDKPEDDDGDEPTSPSSGTIKLEQAHVNRAKAEYKRFKNGELVENDPDSWPIIAEYWDYIGSKWYGNLTREGKAYPKCKKIKWAKKPVIWGDAFKGLVIKSGKKGAAARAKGRELCDNPKTSTIKFGTCEFSVCDKYFNWKAIVKAKEDVLKRKKRELSQIQTSSGGSLFPGTGAMDPRNTEKIKRLRREIAGAARKVKWAKDQLDGALNTLAYYKGEGAYWSAAFIQFCMQDNEEFKLLGAAGGQTNKGVHGWYSNGALANTKKLRTGKSIPDKSWFLLLPKDIKVMGWPEHGEIGDIALQGSRKKKITNCHGDIVTDLGKIGGNVGGNFHSTVKVVGKLSSGGPKKGHTKGIITQNPKALDLFLKRVVKKDDRDGDEDAP